MTIMSASNSIYISDFIYTEIILNASIVSTLMFQITFVKIKCQNVTLFLPALIKI